MFLFLLQIRCIQTSYLSNILHQHIFNILKIYPQKRVNCDILNLKYYICCMFIHLIGMTSQFSYLFAHVALYQWIKDCLILLQLDLKHIHKVNFYPSDDNFTQALLVMLVKNIISGAWGGVYRKMSRHLLFSFFTSVCKPSFSTRLIASFTFE